MRDRFLSEESIVEQTAVIVAQVCPGADDPMGCETGINAWWGEIGKLTVELMKLLIMYISAMAAYPKFLDPMMVCGQLNICMENIKTLVAEPTCEECTQSVAAVADIFLAESDEVIEFLNVNQI